METADYLALAEPATDRFPAPHSPEPFLRDSLNISFPLVPPQKKNSNPHLSFRLAYQKPYKQFSPMRATNAVHLILPYQQNIWHQCKWWSSLLRNFLHPSVTSCTLRTIILLTLQSKTLRKCSSLTAWHQDSHPYEIQYRHIAALCLLNSTVDPRVTTGLTYEQLGLRPKF